MNCLGMRARMALVLGAVVVVLSVFSLSLPAKKGPTTHTAATILQLEKDVPELMSKDAVPGLAIAVIRGGKTTWVHGFGIKEATTGRPVTGDTVFEAASLSKPVCIWCSETGGAGQGWAGCSPNSVFAEAFCRG
jgi:CubicO group peptidase (beta-lactamase class C family)